MCFRFRHSRISRDCYVPYAHLPWRGEHLCLWIADYLELLLSRALEDFKVSQKTTDLRL